LRRETPPLPEGVHPDGIALDTEVTDRIELPRTHAYAVMLGGPERKHLVVCASDTHHPVQIAAAPSATLRVVEVAVPGAGTP
jgi:sugar lactone lactonase YvrE